MESPPRPTCPRCGEPRILAPECPRCGVLYAKARARTAPTPLPDASVQVLPAALAPTVDGQGVPGDRPALTWHGDLEDARDELRLRLFALPVALLGMWLIASSQTGHFLLRTFLSMWLHELGHAMTAWFCGFPAIPGPWKTAVWETRTPLVFAGLAFLLMGLVFRGILLRSRLWVAAGALGLLLQFAGTVLGSPTTSRMLITFAGDGGNLVLGTLLMMTLYLPRESALRRGWLHWGYLIIGAASFVDAFHQWWGARTDFAMIPFGIQEGSFSDPTVLVDQYGWDELMLIQRYTRLGLACLAVLALGYAVGLWRARAALRALEHPPGA
ncbi:hypothetical protein BON30_06930 [Cystobacter ferrugineus]|uniref:Uncharacterized protein n=2 Tax=Cystobacter TaxID=42 RepID=A0A1L9BEM0_9BACT|nr:hypothetical protein [Cystobacter velatus]OJH40675.1 hypothetical protein BON30_06930 [Cystobacter ferrugineus]